jgi:hypothetical protein
MGLQEASYGPPGPIIARYCFSHTGNHDGLLPSTRLSKNDPELKKAINEFLRLYPEGDHEEG